MYAIIRTGGKQAKVREGDVIDVERLRAEGEVSFTPLLVVDDAGGVFSQREVLKGARVVARIVGESAGPKVDLFKYKSKTGYRRHAGHRQRYTTLEVIRIDAPEGAKRRAAVERRIPKAQPEVEAPAAVAPAEPAAKPKPAAKAAPKAAPKGGAAPKAAASRAKAAQGSRAPAPKAAGKAATKAPAKAAGKAATKAPAKQPSKAPARKPAPAPRAKKKES
jgi:large subunit ribosomal protein L21